MVTLMAARGLTMKQLAKEMGISAPTLKKWRSENPELDAAIKRGAMSADDRMESELYQNATDHYAVEDTVEYIYDDAGNKLDERIIRRQYKHIRADTTAQFFWLCNRRPEVWRDIRSIAKAAAEGAAEREGGVVILPEADAPPSPEAETAGEGENEPTGGEKQEDDDG